MEATADLLKRGLVIIVVSVEHIHVVKLQSLQGPIETFLDMFPADEKGGVDIRLGGCSNLSCNDDVLSFHLEILEDFAELGLSLARIVDLSGIEMVDSIGQGNANDFLINRVVFLLGVDHVSEGDDGGLEAGVTEVAVEHLACLEH